MNSNSARGTGRTYKVLEQMLTTVVQSYSKPSFKMLFFFSPSSVVRQHCFNQFAHEHITKINKKCITSMVKNKVVFTNGVRIEFLISTEPLSKFTIFHVEKLRGLGDYLIFEDHTVAEFSREDIWHKRSKPDLNNIDPEIFKRLYMGEWAPPESSYFKEEDLDKRRRR